MSILGWYLVDALSVPGRRTMYRPSESRGLHIPYSDIVQTNYQPIENHHRPRWSALIFWPVQKTNSPPPTTGHREQLVRTPTTNQPTTLRGPISVMPRRPICGGRRSVGDPCDQSMRQAQRRQAMGLPSVH